MWWAACLEDIEAGKKPHEPIMAMLAETKKDTAVNFKLLHRLINYQLHDIEKSDI